MTEQKNIDPNLLKDYVEQIYKKAGLSDKDAGICADCTIKTNLWGVDSHGVLRTPVYVKRILSGAVNAAPSIAVLKGENGPMAHVDGDSGMGYVVADKCMSMAIDKAKTFGLGLIIVKGSNHFGAASLFTRKASEKGMLGLVTTNVIPNIGMPGNKKPVAGNNPLALSAPLAGPFPFSLDISMSAVSGGKILLAQKKGEKIPDTWAIDKDGNPTDDPFKGFKGILLPTGMHKGLGMSFFIDIITGVLSGGPFLQAIKSMYKHPDEPSETSHLFFVLDPRFFMTEDEFTERMKLWVEMIKATPMTDEDAEQLIPGELEYMIEKRRLKEGISLPGELIKDFQELEKELGIETKLQKQFK